MFLLSKSIAPATITTAAAAVPDWPLVEGAGFATATDSLKTISDVLDLITGAGFVTGTDSLKILSDVLDLISGAGFVTATDALHFIRAQLDLVPKTALTVATTAATTAGVIVQDLSAGTPDVVALAIGATQNTFSAWTQVDASLSAISWISHVMFSLNPAETNNWCLEIGTGAGGAEVTKIRLSGRMEIKTDVGKVPCNLIALPIPVKVAAGIRLAARASLSTNNAYTAYMALSTYQVLEV